jgi:hypothetical protein
MAVGAYKGHVGEGSVAASGHDPMVFSLPELSANDPDGVFDRRVLEMLQRSSWRPTEFSKDNGVDKIREKIRVETLRQFGPHIGTCA